MMFKKATQTQQEKYQLDVSMVAFMNSCPFYAHMVYTVGEIVPTRDIDTAATDGRRIYYNPDYFGKFKVPEQVFILAHESAHLVARHPSRFKHYNRMGKLRDLPWLPELGNIAADYVINGGLVEAGIGAINPDWLYDPQIKGVDLWEDWYEKLFKQLPPPPPGGGKQGKPGPNTAKSKGKTVRGQKGDKVAEANGGTFDSVLEPHVDPGTQQEDLPDESEFKEAVARAYAAAKAMGKVPGHIKRMVEELLEPKVDWRDHIRLLITGKIGSKGETWARPNRRRLALHPLVITPGKKAFGCERVVVGVDTSGSIGGDELDAFFAEIGGILRDCKPREVVVIGCDDRVTQVDAVASLDEFEGLREKGIGGGGGTNFCPVFDHVEKEELNPATLVYLTDMMGRFPHDKPAYPVVWCATTNQDPPWGEVVRLKLDRD